MADAKKSKIYNNPGNIEIGQGYAGETGTYANDRERPFAIFDTPQMGVRALTRDLITKIKRFDGDVDAIINQYAPNNENDTKAYQKFIKQQIGNKSKVDESDLPSLITGIIKKENKGSTADYYLNDPKIIEEGIALSSKSFPSNYTYRDALLEYLTPLPVEAREEGGPVNAGQPYLVGEDGPEIVVPEQSGTVIPNSLIGDDGQFINLNQRAEEAAARIKAMSEAPPSSQQPVQSQGPFGYDISQLIEPKQKRKVKYISFDDPDTPYIEVPAEFNDDQTRQFLKSDEAAIQLANKGYYYTYGLEPVNARDPDNLNDWALTSGFKKGITSVKSMGAGLINAAADTFGNEELDKYTKTLIDQYNLDQSAYRFKYGETTDAPLEERIVTLEQMLADENKMSAFLEWAGNTTGSGAATMIPAVLAGVASAVTTGTPIPGIFLVGTSMGIGETQMAQLTSQGLARDGDANAALSLTTGLAYGAVETYLGAPRIMFDAFNKTYGKAVTKEVLKGITKTKVKQGVTKPSLVKELTKGFVKSAGSEGTTEAIQTALTSTAAQLNDGESISDLYTSKEFIKELGESAAAGAMAGGAIGGAITGPVTYFGNAKRARAVDGAIVTGANLNTEDPELAKAGFKMGDRVLKTGLETYTTALGDRVPTEFTIAGTVIQDTGAKAVQLLFETETDGKPFTASVLIPIEHLPKLQMVVEEAAGASTDDRFTNPTERDTARQPDVKSMAKKLKERGFKNIQTYLGLETGQTAIDALIDDYKSYKANNEVIPYEYKVFENSKGETLNDEMLKERAATILKRNNAFEIYDFSQNEGNQNTLTERQETALEKLGWFNENEDGSIAIGAATIEQLKKDTNIEKGKKETNGLIRIKEIIKNGVRHEPNAVRSTALPPTAVESTLTGLEQDLQYQAPQTRTTSEVVGTQQVEGLARSSNLSKIAEAEALTQEQKLYKFDLDKSKEEIATLKESKKELDPAGETYTQDVINLNRRIKDLQRNKYQRARSSSHPLSRILQIKKLVDRMDNNGFKRNLLPFYKYALKVAKQEKDIVAIDQYESLIKGYKPSYEHVVTDSRMRGTGFYFNYTSAAIRQIEAFISETRLPEAFKSGSETARSSYRESVRQIRNYENMIDEIRDARVELNELLGSFDIEPIIKWDSFKGKPTTPEINKIKKRLFGYDEKIKEKVTKTYWSVNENPTSIDRGALTQEMLDALPIIRQQMQSELNSLGLDALSVDLFNKVLNAEGAQLNGKFIIGANAIQVALNANPMVAGRKVDPAYSRNFVMYHESMHYILDNLMTQNEKQALLKVAREVGLKRYNIKKRYEDQPNMTALGMQEEAIADMFAEYMTVTRNGSLFQPKGVMGKVFARIAIYLKMLANALGFNKFTESNKIFEAFDNGVLKERKEIIDQADIQRLGPLNLARAANISEQDAINFLNRKEGTTKVLVSSKTGGDIIQNESLYKAWDEYVDDKLFRRNPMDTPSIPVVTYEGAEGVLVKTMLQKVSGLYKGLTNVNGIPNLDLVESYLQQLEKLDDRTLNTLFAYMQDNLGSNLALSFEELTRQYSRVSQTFAQQETTRLFRNLLMQASGILGNINPVEMYRARLARIRANLPTQSDLTIAGSPSIVYHGTNTSNMKEIRKKGFRVDPKRYGFDGLIFDNFGTHFGTINAADQRAIQKGGIYSKYGTGAEGPVYGTKAEGPSTMAAVLYIRNPLRVTDLGTDWGTNNLLKELTEKTDKMESIDGGLALFVDQIFTKEEANAIREFVREKTKTKPLKEQDAFFNKYLKESIEAKGYDGIVYRNQVEGMDNDHDPMMDSFIIFNNDQYQQVDGNGNPDMRDLNYNASTDGPIEIAIADDFLSTNEKMSRQGLSEHERNMVKLRAATEKFSAMEEVSLTDISTLGKWFSNLSTIARKYGVVSTMWNSIDFMQKLAQNFQSQFAIATKDAFMIYELLGEDAVFLDKAFSISQSSPGQYRPDANGNITFVAPESKILHRRNGDSYTIQQGEVITLQGDAAKAYQDIIVANVEVMKKNLMMTISGHHMEDFQSAFDLLATAYPESLTQLGFDPTVPVTPEQIMNLEYPQIQQVYDSLKTLSYNFNELAIFDETLKSSGRIQALLGNDTVGAETRLSDALKVAKQTAEFTRFDYIPLMRYGDNAVTVVDTTKPRTSKDRVVAYELVEPPLTEDRLRGYTTAGLIRQIERKFADRYNDPKYEITTVKLNPDIIKKFNDEAPKDFSALEAVAARMSDNKGKMFQELLKELNSSVSEGRVVGFDQFITPRREVGGVDGYSGDFMNGIMAFGLMASDFAARNGMSKEVARNYGKAKDYADNPRSPKPKLRAAITGMYDYGVVDAHNYEFSGLRRMGFWWFLGGNFSSGILQTMSAVQFTGPILSQFAGTPKTTVQLTRAFDDARKMMTIVESDYGDTFMNVSNAPKELQALIQERFNNGVLRPGQAGLEKGQAPNASIIPGKRGAVRKAGRIFEQGIMSGVFNTFETFSRTAAWIASYRLASDPEMLRKADEYYSGYNEIWNARKAREGGIATATMFADLMIDETFGNYSKTNRPKIMRGLGSVAFLFQTYVNLMLGLLHSLFVKGNRKTGGAIFAKVMLMMFLTGGVLGMPGGDDLNRAYAFLSRLGGFNTDLRTQMRDMLTEVTGPKTTDFIMNGIFEAYAGVSIQQRITLGNLPGMQQVWSILGTVGMPTGSKPYELFGAPGAIVLGIPQQMIQISNQQGLGQAVKNLDFYMAAAPSFIKNFYRGAYKYPTEGYADTRKGTLLTADLTTPELILQSLGFASNKVAKERDALFRERMIDTKHQQAHRQFNARYKEAYRDLYMAENITFDPSLTADTYKRLGKLRVDVIKFNTKMDGKYAYRPDTARLFEEGRQQANPKARIYSSDKLNIQEKMKNRESLGLDS